MTVRLIKALSPAKLNLFLHVTGRRPGGRHNLQTVFQLLQWGDDLEFERCDTGGCSLESELPDVAPEHNLILRAANLLTRSEHADAGVRIRINKRIPMGRPGRGQLQRRRDPVGSESTVGTWPLTDRFSGYGPAIGRRYTGVCTRSQRLGGGPWGTADAPGSARALVHHPAAQLSCQHRGDIQCPRIDKEHDPDHNVGLFAGAPATICKQSLKSATRKCVTR